MNLLDGLALGIDGVEGQDGARAESCIDIADVVLADDAGRKAIDRRVQKDSLTGRRPFVAPSLEARAGTIELTGHTRRPGLHDLDKAPTLSALLSDEKVLGPELGDFVQDDAAESPFDSASLNLRREDIDRALESLPADALDAGRLPDGYTGTTDLFIRPPYAFRAIDGTPIKYGWPDKGMKAWKEDFSPMQIAQITSYIKSLHGSKPPNAKEKQGELYTEQPMAADSIASRPDTVSKLTSQVIPSN